MKRIICLIMILCLAVSVALADGKKIDGGEERNIQINPAGDNPVEEGISPTTGRNLAEVKAEAPEGAAGLAVTGRYMPIIAQIINVKQGIDLWAPLNGSWADVVYQSCLATNGIDRMSFVFSDVIPDYVGFVRSTRVTHLRLRQEWDCAFVTSGWSDADVPDELAREGIKNPRIHLVYRGKPRTDLSRRGAEPPLGILLPQDDRPERQRSAGRAEQRSV